MAYSDDFKANAITFYEAHRNGTSSTATARHVARLLNDEHGTNVQARTIERWANDRHHVRPEVDKTVEGKKEHLADLFEAFIRKVLPVAEGKMKDASFRDLMTGAGIAADKLTALRGEPPGEDQKQKVNVFIQNHLGSGELPEF